MAKDTPAPAKAPFQPEILRRVTRPVLKMEVDVPAYVKAQSKLYQGKEIKGSGDKAEMKAAVLLDVLDLSTGQEMQIVCGTVLSGILEDSYPGDSYAGLCFQITKRPKVGTKRYFNYEVLQIKDPAAK
jgi:hypothetical protein